MKNIINKFVLLFLILGWSSQQVKGQDIHFSQFYASPLTLNPALTGLIQGCYRVNAMYRNQWANYTIPFVTMSAAGDARFLENKILGEDFVGGGLLFYNDQSGNALLTNTAVAVSGAYHKLLTHNHQLSFGVQLGYVQRSLDPSQLTWPDQAVNGGINPNLPHNETIQNHNISYFDMHTGLFWMGEFTSELSAFAGLSLFHVTNPRENFINVPQNRRPMRYVLHGGTRYHLNENISIVPNFVSMMQATAMQLNIGSAVEYHYPTVKNSKAHLSLGGWYRHAVNPDAVIFVAGIGVKNLNIGFSYDITASGLQPANVGQTTSALELSLTYIGLCEQRMPGSMQINCPRF